MARRLLSDLPGGPIMQERKRAPRKPAKPMARSGNGNQGEGNREADRRYREKASEFARSPRAKQAADEARRALGEGELEPDESGFDHAELDYRDDDDRDVEREQPGRVDRRRN
jgi:hypothetical protein